MECHIMEKCDRCANVIPDNSAGFLTWVIKPVCIDCWTDMVLHEYHNIKQDSHYSNRGSRQAAVDAYTAAKTLSLDAWREDMHQSVQRTLGAPRQTTLSALEDLSRPWLLRIFGGGATLPEIGDPNSLIFGIVNIVHRINERWNNDVSWLFFVEAIHRIWLNSQQWKAQETGQLDDSPNDSFHREICRDWCRLSFEPQVLLFSIALLTNRTSHPFVGHQFANVQAAWSAK